MSRGSPWIVPVLAAIAWAGTAPAVAADTPPVNRPPVTPAPATRDPESRPAPTERRAKTSPPVLTGGPIGVTLPDPPPPYTRPDSIRLARTRPPEPEFPSAPADVSPDRAHPVRPPDEAGLPDTEPLYLEWRHVVRAAVAADVWHVRMTLPQRAALAHGVADSAWVSRLLGVIDRASTLDTAAAARRAPWGEKGVVLAVRFASARGAASVLLLPEASRLQIYDHDRAVGSLVCDHGDALLDLALEVLPDDADVRAARDRPVDAGRPDVGAAVAVDVPPQPVTKAAPEYPDRAREAMVQGTVVVKALVGTDGRVRETRVAKSVPMLDAAAVAAVRQWRYSPAISHGRPVAMWVDTPVQFTLR